MSSKFLKTYDLCSYVFWTQLSFLRVVGEVARIHRAALVMTEIWSHNRFCKIAISQNENSCPARCGGLLDPAVSRMALKFVLVPLKTRLSGMVLYLASGSQGKRG